jgi:hypothetical protein
MTEEARLMKAEYSNHRPAGKRLMLAKCVLVVTLCMSCMLLGEWMYSHRNPERDFLARNLRLLTNLTKRPEVLFMGDSHLAYSILNPELPKDFINVAYRGEHTLIMYLKVAYLREKGLLPRILVLEADPQMVTRKGKFTEMWRYKSIASRDSVLALFRGECWEMWLEQAVFELPSISAENRQQMLLALTKDAEWKLIQKRPKVIDNICLEIPTETTKRWSIVSAVEKNKMATERILHHFEHKDFAVQRNSELLLQIANICHQNGVKLVLLRSPLTSEYRKIANEILPFDFETYYPSLKANSLINARDLYDNSPFLFTDQDHLNKEGSKQFTHWLLNRPELSINFSKREYGTGN